MKDYKLKQRNLRASHTLKRLKGLNPEPSCSWSLLSQPVVFDLEGCCFSLFFFSVWLFCKTVPVYTCGFEMPPSAIHSNHSDYMLIWMMEWDIKDIEHTEETRNCKDPKRECRDVCIQGPRRWADDRTGIERCVFCGGSGAWIQGMLPVPYGHKQAMAWIW